MGTREAYDFAAYMREREHRNRGTRAHCSIEVLIRDECRDMLNIFGAYLDSLNIEDMKLTFTTVHDNKDTIIHLDKVAKVTINKETK